MPRAVELRRLNRTAYFVEVGGQLLEADLVLQGAAIQRLSNEATRCTPGRTSPISDAL